MTEPVRNPWTDARPVLPRWMLTTCYWLGQALFPITFTLVFSWLTPQLPASQLAAFGLAAPLAFAMLWLAIGIHESGHAWVARREGMTVLQAYWWPLEIALLRRGVRVRLAAPKLGRMGLVFSLPPPDMRLGAPHVRLFAGGAIANLLACLLAALMTWQLWGSWPAAWVGSFGLFNAYLAIANLLPFDKCGPSDGLQILRIWKGLDGNDRLDPVTESMSRSVAGETAEHLPVSLVEQVASLGPQGAMLASWMRLKAAQLRGDWQASVAQEQEQARIAAVLPTAVKAQLRDLMGLIRHDLAFSRAMLERDPHCYELLPRDRAIDWLCPQIRPRFAALAAALSGDAACMEAQLQIACAHARNSREHSVAAAEDRLAGHIRALCADVPARQPTRLASA